jgi:FolB domain-containing protein
MDSVEICGLSCRCIIGIRSRERRVAQRVRIDVELQLDLEKAGKSGRIAHTVDYSRASTELVALLKFRRYLLLEVAAEECAGWLFAAYPAVQALSLRMAKPQALAGHAESGGVRIARKRPPEGARVAEPFGYVESHLETSEATISRVVLDAGTSLSPEALGAERALLLPLAAHLSIGERFLHPHEPVTLAQGELCANCDAVSGALVVCAQRRT